jgi:hypothetical protein
MLHLAVFLVIKRRFRSFYCLRQYGDGPDDGDPKNLWNVSQFLPEYTAQYQFKNLNIAVF